MRKKLPQSDVERESVLLKAKTRKDVAPEGTVVFTEANCDKIDELEPGFKAKRVEVDGANQLHHKKVGLALKDLVALKIKSTNGLKLIVSKVLNNDPGFTKDVYSWYGLSLTGKLFARRTEDEILFGGQCFINGETARVAAGGTLLTDIKKVDVKSLLDASIASRLARSEAQTALTNKLNEQEALRIAVDKLIPSMYRDIDHAAKELPDHLRLAFCIDWGMMFHHIKDCAILNVRTEDVDSHAILAGVELRIGPLKGTSGTKAKSNDMGMIAMKSRNFKPTYLIGNFPLYDTSVMPITLLEGETLTVVLKLKKKPVVS